MSLMREPGPSADVLLDYVSEEALDDRPAARRPDSDPLLTFPSEGTCFYFVASPVWRETLSARGVEQTPSPDAAPVGGSSGAPVWHVRMRIRVTESRRRVFNAAKSARKAVALRIDSIIRSGGRPSVLQVASLVIVAAVAMGTPHRSLSLGVPKQRKSGELAAVPRRLVERPAATETIVEPPSAPPADSLSAEPERPSPPIPEAPRTKLASSPPRQATSASVHQIDGVVSGIAFQEAGRSPGAELPAPTTGSVPTRSVPQAQFHGSLAVNCDPAGAQVFVDGNPVGATPLMLEDVRIGSHVVRVVLDGYRPWSSAVRIVANERNDVTCRLDPVIIP